MRARRRSLVLALAATLAATAGLPAATASAQDDPRPLAEAGRPGPADSDLRRLVEAARATNDAGGALAEPVTVEVLGDPAVTAAAVVAAGGTVTGEIAGELVLAEVPLGEVEALEGRGGVGAVRTPLRVDVPAADGPSIAGFPTEQVAPTTEPLPTGEPLPTNTVNGHHITRTNADDWHAQGHTGQNVKIGIVDVFSQASWDAAVAAGDLRQPTGTFCRFNGAACNVFDPALSADHGVEVAELIHDVAPHSALYIAFAYSAADLQAAVDWMAANGVTILSRSLTAEYDGAGNGTGPLAAVVNSAVSQGITWFNSAGNNAGGAGTGSYWRDTWEDDDGDGWMEFSGSDEHQLIYCGVFVNGLRWDDWGANPTDYDVYLVNTTAALPNTPAGQVLPQSFYNTVVTGSENDQTSVGPPLENFQTPCSGAQQAYLVIRRFDAGDGTAGDVLEFMTNGGPMEYASNARSAGGPVSDSANSGMASIGAIDPSAGGQTAIATYSSRGPTNDNRFKPDLSAPSCITTFTAPCFNGTSAATPVVAGLAAVVRSAGMHATPTAMINYLKGQAIDRGTAGTDNDHGWGEARLPTVAPLAPTATGEYHPVTPVRIFDTRNGTGGTVGPVGAGQTVNLDVTGVGNVPGSGVGAVVLNVTGTSPSTNTHVTVWPNGTTRPQASNLNLAPNETAPNLVVVRVGTGGLVRFFNNTGTVHLIADVVGWFDDGSTQGGEYTPLDPVRLADTRGSTFTGLGLGTLGPGETRNLDVTGVGPLPASGVGAVVLNVTGTGPSANTHLTLWPGNEARPNVSNVNLVAGQTRPNLAIVKVGANGMVQVRNNSGDVHVIVDVVGWFNTGAAEAGEVRSIDPVRVLDTRNGTGHVPGPLGTTAVTFVAKPGGGVPHNATAVILNVTAVSPSTTSHLSLWPNGVTQPTVSNLNYTAGQTVPNLVVVRIGSSSGVRIRNNTGSVHVIADVVGYVVG